MRPVPLTAPLPVEITNHTEWWVQWLPVAGSALLAIGALIGVVLSNRVTVKTSRHEREDARQRDLVLWRREELRRLGAEVVRAARDAMDEFSKIASLSDQPLTAVGVEPIDQASRTIAANAEILGFLSAYEVARRCVELRNSLMDLELIKAAKHYHVTLGRDRAAGLGNDEPSDARKAAEADFNEQLQKIQVMVRLVGFEVEKELRQLNTPELSAEPEPHL